MEPINENGNENPPKAGFISTQNGNVVTSNEPELFKKTEFNQEYEKERIKMENLSKLTEWFSNHL